MKHGKKNGKIKLRRDTDYYTQPRKKKLFIRELSVYIRREI
jgi:hypothetical protein